MPRVSARSSRLLLSLVLSAGLVALPGTASGDAAVRFSEHAVSMFCHAEGEAGVLDLFVGVSSEFGPSADLTAWVPPIDLDSPPDYTGSTTDVTVVEANGGAALSTSIPLVDADGNKVGDVVIAATLTPTGEVITLEPFRDGNRWVKTTGTIASMEVTGTLDAPEGFPDFALQDLGCGGEIVDLTVFETNPNTFVGDNSGVILFCDWESDGTFAHLFAVSDDMGTYAETSLFSEGQHDIFGSTDSVNFDASSLAASIPWDDFLTGATGTATATATFTPFGDPVKSVILGQNLRQNLLEQRLIPDGSLVFSSGEEFAISADACDAHTFDIHVVASSPTGPKPGGKPPANDAPEGALALTIGDSLNQQTGGASPEAEIPVTPCPDPDDAFGYTLWYSFTGTGGEVTIDTAGSNFDTVLAVYDDQLNQIACADDVFFDPIGSSFQAALTLPTVEGATYYIQAGGFSSLFFGSPGEFGRLRLSIN